jgi:hypothetical protein
LLDDEVARESESFAAMILENMSFSQLKNVKRALALIYLSFVNNANQQNKNYTDAFIVLLQPLLRRLTIQVLKAIQDKMRSLQSLLPDSPLNYLYGNVTGIVTQLLKEKEKSAGEAEDRFPNILQNPGDESEITKPDSIPDEHIYKPDGNLQEAADEQQDYFLDNSGLVLLNWALIQNNLEQLGWVKERKITDEQSRNKILIWMDYLVWGQRRLHEYGLTLNKVLLGMHPADIADIHESISASEKKAAEVLLNAVIENWSVLKSTSIDGLRTSFVQRNGRLSNEDGGWQMHVESKGLDILIDSLPWTYSIIKTPWMEKPLFTQWSTKA